MSITKGLPKQLTDAFDVKGYEPPKPPTQEQFDEEEVLINSEMKAEGLKPLNHRQRRFVEELFKDPARNAKFAAHRAGYKTKTSPTIAWQLTNLPSVAYVIKRKEEEILRRNAITHDRVAQALAAIAFNDPRNFFHEDGRLKKMHELTDREAFAISALDIEETTDENANVESRVAKIRRWDPNKALDSLAKMFGFNAPEKVDATVQAESVVNIVPFGKFLPLASNENEIAQ